MTTTTAIITHAPLLTSPRTPNWSLRPATLAPLGPTHVLIRTLASGICHTDIVFSSLPASYIAYPRVNGHEGAGIVEAVGAAVSHVVPGDPVLLSFASCGNCGECANQTPGYCAGLKGLNYGSVPGQFTWEGEEGEEGGEAAGGFFGQSSFANRCLVEESCVVNVNGLVESEEELKLFAPFGCGMQTGCGAVTEVVDAGVGDRVCVVGLGAVGFLSVMVS
jgi:Zn-dependent alcohol dehydrogenase